MYGKFSKFRKKFEGVKLYDPGNNRLKRWTGELVKSIVIAGIDVVLEGQSKRLPLLVTPGKQGDQPTLRASKT